MLGSVLPPILPTRHHMPRTALCSESTKLISWFGSLMVRSLKGDDSAILT
jgi:hypothetical protein